MQRDVVIDDHVKELDFDNQRIFTTKDGVMCPLEDRCHKGDYGGDDCCNQNYPNCYIYQGETEMMERYRR